MLKDNDGSYILYEISKHGAFCQEKNRNKVKFCDAVHIQWDKQGHLFDTNEFQTVIKTHVTTGYISTLLVGQLLQ